MRTTRALVGISSLALTATAIGTVTPPSLADPGSPAAVGGKGRGPDSARSVPAVEKAKVARAAADAPPAGEPIRMPSSYPFQPALRVYETNPADASYAANLIGHADLAPRLTALMAKSNRVSVQVVGQSTAGRDLYLVTVTAPESTDQTALQTKWREKIKSDPAAAAKDPKLLAGYKTPVWISNNIHGNEWEGTDGAMRYIEYLATAPLSEVGGTLRNNRVYFSPSLNPDGRTIGTRATALGLDANRDMITNATPESLSFIRTAQAIQPIYAADFHGYTRVLQVEPCGPPHGSNYEYDVYLPHNYALALQVEKDVTAANIPGNTYLDLATGAVTPTNTGHIKIPYRDTPSGWDDFPPIFTAQYAAYYGAATSTVELPLSRPASNRQDPGRAATNTAVAYETMKSMVGYMSDPTHAREMLANQIEVFRRGAAGEPKDSLTASEVAAVPGPTEWKAHWDVADDQEPVSLPRAFVIPAGAEQRSASDATRLVRQLMLHDIEVGVLRADTTIGGTTYPQGSFVVDMHQPLRGLANALLDLGDDISSKVPEMYDISAWSLGELWGATVDKVGSTTDGPIRAVTPVVPADLDADLPGRRGPLSLDLAGVLDYKALNVLLEESVEVSLLQDGTAVVAAEGYDEAATVADSLDVDFDAASAEDLAALDDASTKGLADLTVGYVGTQDDRLSLTELGFDDLVQLSVQALNADPALLDGVDVLWIGSGFNPEAGSAARTAVQGFVDRGGSIVGRSNQAFAAAASFGLLSGTAVAGNPSGNGIVDVETPAGSVLEPYALDTSFIYPAYWFTGLGEGVKVEQRYDAEDAFLAGHWRASNGANGPENAAGQASAVSSTDEGTGAKAFVFGTSVFFRTHPKGAMGQAARALFWAAPEAE